MRSGLDPYDRATWAAAVYTDPVRVPPCARTFVYPMPTSMAMAPLSLLPEPVALAVWDAVLLASVLGGIALLRRIWPALDARPLTLVALWSEPMYSAIGNVQFGPVIFLALASLAYAAERGRQRLWVVSWSALLVKPHITFLVLSVTPFLRGTRAVATAAAVAIAVVLASLVLAPRWPFEYVDELFGQALAIDPGLATLWTVATDHDLPAIAGGVAAIAAAIAFFLALPRRIALPRVAYAELVAASFLVTPYARPHDFIALLPCWAATVGVHADRRRRDRYYAGVVAVALVLPWLITGLTTAGLPPSTHVLVSLSTAALLAVALRRDASG